MTVGVGDSAPDFELLGTGDRKYALADFRGQPVVLAFYPADNTPVCTTQLRSYTNDFERFEGAGAQLLAISPQSVESHEQFSCKQGGFKFPLLADEDMAVGRAYGVVGPLGFYRRCAFVVDADGVIRYAHRAVAGLTYRRTAELLRAVQSAT